MFVCLNVVLCRWEILDNKVRFIEAVIADTVHVRGKAKRVVVDELDRHGFRRFAPKKKANKNATSTNDEDDAVAQLLGEDEPDPCECARDGDLSVRRVVAPHIVAQLMWRRATTTCCAWPFGR